MTLRLRRGNDLERQSITFQEGELVYITDTKDLYAGDGTTVGGIKVSNIGSPSSLTQNLNLNGYNIQGSGTISATAFVGDGSALTGIDIGVQSGQEYDIDIRGRVIGFDSTAIIDPITNTIYGNFFGDGSLISNIAIDQLDGIDISFPQNGDILAYSNGLWVNSPVGEGIVEGSDYTINIIGIDSSLIVNANNGVITPTEITYNTAGGLRIKAIDNNQSEVRLYRTTVLPSGSNGVVGILYFDTLLSDGNESTVAFVYSGGAEESGSSYVTGFLELNVIDDTGNVTEDNALLLTGDGKTGLGTFNPTERLDVRGNGIFTGTVTAASFKGSIVTDDSTTFVDAINGTISASGYIQFGSYTTIEKDQLNAVNGMVIYNSAANRFQGFQNGSWINLDDGTPA